MMPRHILVLLCVLLSPVLRATHVLGGEMYYDRLAGNQYRITLKLYRDCGPDNTNGTAFDAEVQLAVYDGNGLFMFTENVPFPGEETVPVDLSDPCLAAPPSICATWAEYITVIDLPPNTSGYSISYQRCCRTPTLVNLPAGLQQGLTCTVQIPAAAIGQNSSPRFNDYPPIAMCFGRDMVIDHSATDPDGDELVYDLFTPYSGGTATDPMPLAGPPPYSPIVWAAGYSGGNPMDATPPMAIDGTSGVLTVHPTLLGSFAVGVRVREYRNGQLLSASIRDLRFDVVSCEIVIISSVQEQQEFCTGTTVEFVNESNNGNFWHWDFGEVGILADTSDLQDPVYTYGDTGTFPVTLIANPGWPCADTSISTVEVHLPLDPHFDRPPILCPNEPASFQALGNFTSNAFVTWGFGASASSPELFGPNAVASFLDTGPLPVLLTVQEFGCEASYEDSVIVHPRIVSEAWTDSAGCAGQPFRFNSSASANTPVFLAWNLGDGGSSDEVEFVHVYALPGTYDVSLTAWTLEGCIDQRTIAMPDRIEVYPVPVAEFVIEPEEVGLLDPRIEVKDHSQNATIWSYTIEGLTITEPSFSHYFDDAGLFEVTQTVISGENCSSSVTHTIHVTDHLFYAPTAFTPNGDGLNDTFAPRVKGARLYEITLTDRWGSVRFQSTDPNAEWSGDDDPDGVYNYVVRIAEFGAYRKEYRGHVTLLR